MDKNNSTIQIEFICENDLCKAANYVWMIISPVLLVFGLFGGFLIATALIRIRIHTSPLSLFLFILTITDVSILCVGLVRLWIMETWELDIRDVSNAGCKLLHFLVYFSMQFSSWILVCVTIERFLKCRYIVYSSMVTIRRCKLAIGVVFLVLGSLNSHYFWTHGFITTQNKTTCGVQPGYETFDEWYIKVDLFILCVVPFIIMMTLDFLILRILKAARLFRQASVATSQMYNKLKKVDQRLTKMLLITNLYFLFSTLPVSIIFILKSYLNSQSETLYSVLSLIGSIVYTLQYSNYSVNCIFYTVYDKRIRRHIKQILGIAKPRYLYKDFLFNIFYNSYCQNGLEIFPSAASTSVYLPS